MKSTSGIQTNISSFPHSITSTRLHLNNVLGIRHSLGHRCIIRWSAPPGRKFSDFLEHSEEEDTSASSGGAPKSAEEKAQELIERTAAILARTQAALAEVRTREPADSRHRRSGPDVYSGPTVTTTSKEDKASTAAASGGSASGRPAITTLPLAWQSDDDEDEDEEDGGGLSFLSSKSGGVGGGGGGEDLFGSAGGGGGGGGGFSSSTFSPGNLDSWFGGKVDTGPVSLRPAAVTPTASSAIGVAVLERPNHPTSLEFAPPEAPEESGAATIFPESLAIRFQSEEQEEEVVETVAAAAPAPASDAQWERTSGEEFGPNGYWYRWTEVQGRDSTGAVLWSERWWEVSDWKGMKELGAEKWGSNDRGDAWRESWRESIGFDEVTGQPMVERTAHKWARAGSYQEWEEKWGETYLSGGRAEKWADKWGREGSDVWHERWGENYDGEGGCVKWTDRWAERPPPLGSGAAPGALDKWGDKWEETFKDGRGAKKGETWSEKAHGESYNRWWGENHHGDGTVQKYGHSSTGEQWDVTEHMDTYYNPIPHFGYDLALAHSPQLREVPMLPRDTELGGGGGGNGGDGGDGDGDDLSSLFG